MLVIGYVIEKFVLGKYENLDYYLKNNKYEILFCNCNWLIIINELNLKRIMNS